MKKILNFLLIVLYTINFKKNTTVILINFFLILFINLFFGFIKIYLKDF